MPLAKLIHPDSRNLLRRVSVCPEPTDITGNASYTLEWTAGQLTKITKVMGGVTYERTLTYTGSDLTGVTVWTVV